MAHSPRQGGVCPTLVGGAFVSTPAALDSGTLTSEPVHVCIRQYNSSSPSGGWGVESRVWVWIGLGTLLGPEISVAQPQ